jgi:predicted RNA-binding protein
MVDNKAENEPAPQPTRMATRARNATAHPGTVDARRVRRTKEEVAKEKELKNLQAEAKEQKKIANEARKASGEAHFRQLEKIEAAATANAEREFPRHRGFLQWNICLQSLMSI